MAGKPNTLDAELRQRVQQNLNAFERRSVALEDRRAAAVAVTLVANDQGSACFLITRRADALKRHRGQWALPGGRLDPGENAEQAALRELDEELGLKLASSEILGVLDDYGTRSGFVITPIVVWGGKGVELIPDPSEVAEAYRVPLSELHKPEVPHLRQIPESDRPVISLPMLGTHIHAPTAAILYQLREVALEGRDTRVDHFEQPVFAWR